MEFKDKVMLNGFREVKCQWELVRWEGGKGGRVMSWQGGKGASGEVGGSWVYSTVGNTG